MGDLRRTAYHEAGHCCASWLLGATVGAGPVTIEPGKCYNGISFIGRPAVPTAADMAGLARPYPLLPARLRRFYEIKVCTLLAGEIAADLYATRSALPITETVTTVTISSLPVREQIALDEAASDDQQSDFSKVMGILLALHFDDPNIAEMHCRFLAAETQAVLSARRSRLMVEALAAELLTHRTLSAQRWKSCLASC